MKTRATSVGPHVCSGTYFPRRGRPQREYYVLVDEIVVAGPFKTKRSAIRHLSALPKKGLKNTLSARIGSLKRLDPSYARTIKSVLREQEKALTAGKGS